MYIIRHTCQFYIYIYIYIYIYEDVYIRIRVYVHIYIYIYTYICCILLMSNSSLKVLLASHGNIACVKAQTSARAHPFADRVSTQRLQCGCCLVMIYFLPRYDCP